MLQHRTHSWNSASLHNTHHIFLKFCKVCTTHTTYSWNFVKSAQHTGRSLLYQKACVHNTWTISNCPQEQKQQHRPFHTSCTTTKTATTTLGPLTPPVQQRKQQQWVLSWSIKSHSTKEVGCFEKKKQAAAAQRDLEQLWQFQQRGATSGLSHKNLNPGFNTANRIPSQHWFGVLKVCLCLFFYIATSDDCTSAGLNICELLSWDALVIIWSSKHKGGRWSSKAGMWVNSIRTKDKV